MKRLKKILIQSHLEPEQERIVGLLAKTSGKSKAVIIRSCISKFLKNIPMDIMSL
jgi:predicted DNA-binding protein